MPASVKRVQAALRSGAAPAPRFLPLETIFVRLRSPLATDRRPVFGVVSNMSETGACVITNLALPVNAKVVLEIDSSSAGGTSRVSARVVWCAERLEPVREIVGYLTGVCFDRESIESVRRLLQSAKFQPLHY